MVIVTNSNDIVADLRALAARREALDRAEANLIATARSLRVTWTLIADALSHSSRQAAEQRYQRLSKRIASVKVHESGESVAPDDPIERLELFRVPNATEKLHRTRIRLIRSAAALLSEQGYATTRLRDIAIHAGIQPGSFYYHYRSKDDLIEDVLKLGVARANEAVIDAVRSLPAHATGTERLKTAIHAHLRAMLSLDSIAKAHVFAYGQVPTLMKERIRPVRRTNAELWSALVRDALDEGTLRRDVDPFLIQLFLVNTVDAALNWSSRARNVENLTGQLTRLVLEGIGA